jgi:hypothetical protein
MLSALDTFDTGEEPPQEWWVGQKGSLNRQPHSQINYCEFWNPKKEMVQRGRFCDYTQSIVTDADDGNWTFVYGMDGKLLEGTIVQEITVTEGKGTSLL